MGLGEVVDGALGWVKNLFLGAKSAELDYKTEQDIKTIEDAMDKDFEFYMEKYEKNYDEMNDKREKIKGIFWAAVSIYTPVFLGGSIDIIDYISKDRNPSTSTYIILATGIVLTFALRHIHKKFKKVAKKAEKSLDYLRYYIKVNRDALMKRGKSVKEIIEYADNILENDEEFGQKVKIYQKSRATEALCKYDELAGRMNELEKQVLRNKLAGQESSSNLKAIKDEKKEDNQYDN